MFEIGQIFDLVIDYYDEVIIIFIIFNKKITFDNFILKILGISIDLTKIKFMIDILGCFNCKIGVLLQLIIGCAVKCKDNEKFLNKIIQKNDLKYQNDLKQVIDILNQIISNLNSEGIKSIKIDKLVDVEKKKILKFNQECVTSLENGNC